MCHWLDSNVLITKKAEPLCGINQSKPKKLALRTSLVAFINDE